MSSSRLYAHLREGPATITPLILSIGTGDPAKLKDWVAQNSAARVGSFSDAAQFGEVVVLAVKGSAAGELTYP